MNRRRDQYIQIARRYYIDEISQQQIAKEFELSRPTVSNILKKCREMGIVEIRIKDGSPLTTALGEQLKRKYGLREAIVIPSEDDETSLLSRIGAAAADLTSSMLHDGIQIGIAWGTTLYQMVHQIQPAQLSGANVIQLMGGFGAENPHYDGSELARDLSKTIHADYYPIQSPVIVKNIVVKEMLMKEPSIEKTLRMMSSLEVAFVGLSSIDPENSALVRSGFLSYDEAARLQAAGGVGHICGYSYDRDGRCMDIPINERIIGIAFDDFLRIPVRVGVACGCHKADAIQASLRGGHLTTLITDELAASELISR